MHHLFSAVEERHNIYAHDGGPRSPILSGGAEELHTISPQGGGGHNAKMRWRGVATADARPAEKDVSEAVAFGHLLHLRAGVGDGDETIARFFNSNDLV